MDLFGAINRRHSYRGEYQDVPVPGVDLEKIVDAGIRAPSGCNAQTTSFVIVDDPEMLKSIAQIVDKPCTSTAKAMIVCIAEHRDVYHGMSFAVEDCAAAVENMLLAITACGYASVWLDGVLRRDGVAQRIAALLEVPADREIRIMLPVGVPVEVCSQNQRQPFSERAWFNKWGG